MGNKKIFIVEFNTTNHETNLLRKITKANYKITRIYRMQRHSITIVQGTSVTENTELDDDTT